MKVWFALVLIVMTLVVGAVAYFTSSPWALLGFMPILWLGYAILNKDSSQT